MVSVPSHSLFRRARTTVAAALAVTATIGLPSVVASPASAAPTAGGAATAAAPSFSFEGGGFGHGVGMSQYGAKGQGDAGRSESQILASYYPGTAITAANPPGPTVLLPRVDCSGIAAEATTTLLPSGGSIQIYIYGPTYGQFGLTSVQSGQAARITVTGTSGAYFRVESPELGSYALGNQADMIFVRLNGVPTRLGMNNTRYSRGNLVIDDNSPLPGQAPLLNGYAQDMTMDQYLYGLSEVPSSWPAATLRAQAIAGRTYAERVAAPRRNAGNRFQIYGSTLDQCYRGYEKEGEPTYGAKWVSAVDATSQKVLTYNGAMAQTFYSSSNGGYSERSGYVFSQDLPYLQAQPDPYDDAAGNSLHRWTRTFDGDQLGSRIGGGVGRVTALAISGSVGESGRINRASVSVTGTTGSRTITGSQLRSLLSLPDTLIFRILRDGCVIYGPGAGCGGSLPAGSFDSATPSGSSALVQGWAADPDSSAAVEIDVWVDGAFAGYGYANQPRPDVADAYPSYGPNRGFSFTVPVPVGSSSVCAYAIDVNIPSTNRPLGCRTVTRSNSAPFGNIDAAVRVPGGAQLQGWALDPDTSASVQVHAYANGKLVGYGTASGNRPDIDAAFPGYGAAHGFAIDAALPSGNQTVCLYAINIPSGVNPSLGCRTVDVSPVPIGNLDSLVRQGDVVYAQGWGLDPDVAGSIEVHVLVDGAFAGWGYASAYRSDIGAAFPYYGPNHGFSISVPVAAGGHTVCVYGINAGPGFANRFLGCKSV